MLKITRMHEGHHSHTRFSFKGVNSLEYCIFYITLFGKSFQIKYSPKFNYFYIAQQVRRQKLMIDSVSLAFVRHILLSENKLNITSLERIYTNGCSSDFYLKGVLDNEYVFIKVNTSRVTTDSKIGEAMKNEYEKSLFLSEICQYVPKPLYYIKCLPFEILISPYIYNLISLEEVINSKGSMPAWIEDQLTDLISLLKQKKLIHRDINGGNISIGNLKNGSTQLFLNDLAYMTFLDDNGNPVTTNVENKVDNPTDEPCFDLLLRRIRKKMEIDGNKK